MWFFGHRRIRNTGVLLLVLVAVWLVVRVQERNLGSSAFTTGYLLIGAVVFLALYNVRKKLPFLPLGSSATWLTWHLYVGLGTLGLFGMHVGLTLPRGILDGLLASVYLLTFASGVVGLHFTRTIPAQLARVGEEVIYERIPAFRRQVRQQAADVCWDRWRHPGRRRWPIFTRGGCTRFLCGHGTRGINCGQRPCCGVI